MILSLLAIAVAPEPLSRDPFMDEDVAAHAFEEEVTCIGSEVLQRRGDVREAHAVAADVIKACNEKAAILQTALANVYRRKPSLLHDGLTPDEAAKAYISNMNFRIEAVIEDARKHN